MVADMETDVLEETWGPNGIGNQPEDTSFHESDEDVPPVSRRRPPPAGGPWEGGLGPTTYYR